MDHWCLQASKNSKDARHTSSGYPSKLVAEGVSDIALSARSGKYWGTE
jgi:hypothetical protein